MKFGGYVTEKVTRTIEVEEKVFKEILPYKPLRWAVVSSPRSPKTIVDSKPYIIGLFPSEWAAKDYIETIKIVHEPITRVHSVMEVSSEEN